MKKPDQQEPADEHKPAGPYKSLAEIAPVGVNDEGHYVDADGTLWLPVPGMKDAYWRPAPPDLPPQFEMLSRLAFHFARSMAEVPHWWCKAGREPPRDEDFWALFEAINKFGVSEMWNGRRYKYLYPGNGFRYWHVGPVYRIINRSRSEPFGPVDEALKEKAAEWTLRDEKTGIDEIRARQASRQASPEEERAQLRATAKTADHCSKKKAKRAK
jgi:hypothetical protein